MEKAASVLQLTRCLIYECPDDIEWHYIGRLQSNKMKGLESVKGLVVESCESVRHLDVLNAFKREGRNKVRVYVQVNTSGEERIFTFLECDG